VNRERLDAILAGFPDARIGVVGDYFLDKYLDVDPALVERSVETGKPAHQVVGVRHSSGAAGTVVCNLVALDAGAVHAVGYVGDDGEGVELLRDLRGLGAQVDGLIATPDRFTPTYLKPRDAAGGLEAEHERYDTKNRAPTPAALEDRVIACVRDLLPHVDAVIVADQVEEAECGVGPVVVTSAEQGALVCDAECTGVPGVHVDGPTDPTGAGDSFTAGAVLALAAGATLAEAALVGNLTASITVEALGTTGTASRGELRRRLDLWRRRQRDGVGL